MLKKLLCCALLFVPAPLLAAGPGQPQEGSNGDVNWKVQKSWSIPAKSLDFVQTLDEKKVFVLTNDSKVRVFTADGRELGAVPVSSGVSAIDIAPRGEMLYLMDSQGKRYSALSISINQKLDVSGAPVRGKADAPVTIVEFSDFQCPFCIQTVPVVEAVLAAHPDTVRLIFKHMPLRMHPQAESAARAAIAAQKQGKFWEMHDALFTLGENDWGSESVIESTAKKIGLDMARFTADWNSEDTRMRLTKDMMDAQNADVTGTPTLFINGKPVEDRTKEVMTKMIADALAAKNSGATEK